MIIIQGVNKFLPLPRGALVDMHMSTMKTCLPSSSSKVSFCVWLWY